MTNKAAINRLAAGRTGLKPLLEPAGVARQTTRKPSAKESHLMEVGWYRPKWVPTPKEVTFYNVKEYAP